MAALVRLSFMDHECWYGERREEHWVRQTAGKRICVSSARHGWEILQIQILQQGCQNSPIQRECARMTGKCIPRTDCAGILKRISCIYKAGRLLNQMEEGMVNG